MSRRGQCAARPALDAANSYGALVGVPSSEQPGVLRVKPGDAANSYLVQKIEGHAAVGARMPLGLPPLPDATILVIRQWIDSGASSGTSMAASSKPLVVDTITTSAAFVTVAMSRPVDTTLVGAGTVMLQKLSSSSPEPVTVKASMTTVSPVNEALIVLEPTQALTPGRYRLILRGTGAAALADWNASIIDGDADGVAGGDFIAELNVGDAP